MATTGEIAFTEASSAADAGTGHIDEAWVTPANALDSNDTYASVTAGTFDSGDQTEILRVFNAATALTSALPADLVSIDGVIVRINGYSDSAALVDLDLVQLLDAAGGLSGTNLAATSVALGTNTAAIHTFGSTTEKWGLGAGLTRALLIDPQFGVGIGVLAQTANSQCFVDYVTIEVVYTPAPVTVSGAATFEITLTADTNGVTERYGALDSPFTFDSSTSSLRTTYAASDTPITFGVSTDGTVTPAGGSRALVAWAALQAPILAGATVTGAASAEWTFDYSTSGVTIRYGAVDSPFVWDTVSSAIVAARGSVTSPFVWDAAAAAIVGAHGSVTTPFVWDAVTDGQIVGTLKQGSVTSPFVFDATTAGITVRYGTVDFPITLDTATSALVTRYGTVTLPLTWDAVTAAYTARYGSLSEAFVWGVDVDGNVTGVTTGSVTAPFTFAAATSGLLTARSSIDVALAFAADITARLGIAGAVDAPFTWTVDSQGIHVFYGSIDQPLVFTINVAGIADVTLLDAIYTGRIGTGWNGQVEASQGRVGDTVGGLPVAAETEITGRIADTVGGVLEEVLTE